MPVLRRQRVATFVLASILFGTQAFAADTPGWSYQLAHDIMSPFCPGLSLSDCPSPNAAELREWIIEQEAAGASQEAVEEQLLARFGDQLLQAPRPEGAGLFAYAIPLAVFLLGAAFVGMMLFRRGEDPAAVSSGGTSQAATSQRPAAAGVGADADLERAIDLEIGD